MCGEGGGGGFAIDEVNNHVKHLLNKKNNFQINTIHKLANIFIIRQTGRRPRGWNEARPGAPVYVLELYVRLR